MKNNKWGNDGIEAEDPKELSEWNGEGTGEGDSF